MKLYLILIFLILTSCKKNSNKDFLDSEKINDSILLQIDNAGAENLVIDYPSKQKDSFKLKVRYRNGILLDSSYITDSGVRTGKHYRYNKDSILFIHEFLANGTLNQYWSIKGNDTLGGYGNHYNIFTKDTVKVNELFKFQIILRLSYEKNFSSLFFVYAENGFELLNEDMSNLRDIDLDTIYNLYQDEFDDNDNIFDDYWSKRAIMFRHEFQTVGDKIIRGVLVERKDSTFISADGDKLSFLERYLLVNKSIHVIE
ncbi:hypothetical protein FJ651_15430 [Paucihalobacter ruber]|uniref:Uncharacterized protein n=1 Tax=Paucihalobacter ruber TaxID=2567861 RepID=A0A506PC98_9FLAO|nr:hypothetical protein [Paucihalobacter ruber]TPV31154.1 hypothetical protein FJ651_15430 [Paucihalobacter ruber]